MILRTKHLVPVIAVLFIAGIGGTMALGWWKTESSKVPARYTAGEFEGEFNPGDIRGSYTFGDVSAAFFVPVDALAKAFALDSVEDPASFQCKELEDLYGEVEGGEIGTDSVRLFVSLYAGLPYAPQEDTLLLAQSLSVLADRLSEEQLIAAQQRTVRIAAMRSDALIPEAQKSGEHVTADDRTVRGKTTFQDLYDWGLSEAQIGLALGMSVGKPGVTVRDHVMAAGVEFSSVKSGLQRLVNELEE